MPQLRRRSVIAACALVGLVVLAVVANVVLTGYVKDGVVRALRCATGDESITPHVSLGRTPVLADFVSREVGQVRITGLSPSVLDSQAAELVADGELSLTLHGVGLGDPPTVRSAAASVRLSWDEVSSALAASPAADELAGAQMAAVDGLLAVTLPEEVGGQPVKVLLGLRPEGDSLTATPKAVIVRGRRIGVQLVSVLTGDLLEDENGESRLKPRTVDLDLPTGAALESIRVQSAGLALGLSIDPALVGRPDAATGPDCRS